MVSPRAATVPAAGRPSALKPYQGLVASLPEAAGLPYDEGFLYLVCLRRYVVFGPTLGLATPPMAAAAGGRQPGVSIAGAGLVTAPSLAAASGAGALIA